METQTREKSKNPKTGSKSKRKKESVDYTLQRDKAEEEGEGFSHVFLWCFIGHMWLYCQISHHNYTHCMCVCDLK